MQSNLHHFAVGDTSLFFFALFYFGMYDKIFVVIIVILELEGNKFDLDIEKTREYYRTHSLCDCVGCRNFYIQAKEKYPLLNNLLEKFGVDISKPDEIAWGDIIDGELDYIIVHYTINGKILEFSGYEIDINDSTFVNVVLDTNYVPNNQETKDYFVISIYGILLPYILDEPFTTKEEIKKKFFDFFRRKKKQKN